ncbi:MAG TPA: MFS transporter [Thermomicrobiales bacterium]|jgi:MFS family permease
MSGQAHSAAPSTASERLGNTSIFQVIGASAVGTMIEWYDFYIFGSLAAVIALQFYPKGNPTAALLSTLATFAAGFAARPFGALFFGRIGDIVGRKYAFLVTLLIMGGATFLIGLLPGYDTIGIAAPIILVTIRILQGLALGGEYGGAATYVAEHVPDNRRGFYTSFIQTTATLGLFVSLIVILAVRELVFRGNIAAWNSWGWRIPFLLSAVLVGVSLFIRLRLRESPLFTHLKTTGKTSTAPITDSLGSKGKWQTILLVLWGAAAGQAVVWYTGQFYALSWLQGATTAKVSFVDANVIIAIALALGTPFFIVFGSLSDRIGRKPIMMAGNLLGALLTFPLFRLMYHFSPLNNNYNPVAITACAFVLVLLVTMVYGPIAAFLVESFPSQVRYTSVSLPYHIGNGYFGGFLPLIATAVVAAAEKHADWASFARYMGLIFPISVALITFVVGSLLLRETKDNSMNLTESNQIGYRPAIFGGLIGLSVIALVLADQLLLPQLDASNTSSLKIQTFFRALTAIVVLVSVAFGLSRRSRAVPAPASAGDD